MTRPSEHAGRLLFPIQLAGRVGLAVSAAALLILAATLLFISDEVGNSYLQVLQSYQHTGSALRPALLLAGLAMLAVAGLVTWLVSLYGSFRIAGPLYRLRRNLEEAIEHGPVEPVPIRRTDRLHTEAQALERASNRLRGHYAELGKAARRATQAGEGEQSAAEWLAAIEHLRVLDGRARI